MELDHTGVGCAFASECLASAGEEGSAPESTANAELPGQTIPLGNLPKVQLSTLAAWLDGCVLKYGSPTTLRVLPVMCLSKVPKQ